VLSVAAKNRKFELFRWIESVFHEIVASCDVEEPNTIFRQIALSSLVLFILQRMKSRIISGYNRAPPLKPIYPSLMRGSTATFRTITVIVAADQAPYKAEIAATSMEIFSFTGHSM